MTNATTEATKLNFMTDQGSSLDRVSIAWRLFDRRTLTLGGDFTLGCDLALESDPPRKADVTELASPAAAPPRPAAAPAALDEKPPLDDAPGMPLAAVGALKPAESAAVAVVGASVELDHCDRE
jgi:hypothetical protein